MVLMVCGVKSICRIMQKFEISFILFAITKVYIIYQIYKYMAVFLWQNDSLFSKKMGHHF